MGPHHDEKTILTQQTYRYFSCSQDLVRTSRCLYSSCVMLVQVANKKNNMGGEIHQSLRVIAYEEINNIFTVALKIWLYYG